MSQQGRLVIPGLAAAGFLLGRSSVYGVLWPFGAAYLAAVSRYRPGAVAAVAVAAALGGYSAGGFWPGLSQALSGGFYILVLARMGWPGAERGVGAEPTAAAWGTGGPRGRWMAAALVATLLGYGVPALGRTPTPYGVLLVLFQCGLVAFLALLFDLGLRSLPDRRGAGAIEERSGLLVLAAASLAGLRGLAAGPFDLQAVATAAWLWQAARFGGNGGGAAAGLAVGVLQALGGAGAAAALGVHGLAGLLGGLGREFGRWGLLGGLSLGYGLAGMLAGGTWLAGQLPGILAGMVLSLILPAEFLKDWLAGSGQVAPGNAGRREVGGSLVSERLRGLAQVFTELSRSFQELAVTEPLPPPEQEMSMLVSRLAGQVCHGCGQYEACWLKAFFDRYRMAVDLFAVVEAGAGAGALPADWRGKCIQPEAVAREAAYLVELRDVNRRWRRKLDESRDLMAGHLAGLVRVLEELAREVRGESRPDTGGARPPRLGYSTEVAKLARDGRLVCGDSHLVKELSGDRLLLVLSDGMGAGDRAAGESRAAISLLERLLDAGFDRKVAIRTVNSILVLRSPEESFATLDLALIDLRSGEAEFIKVGAAPTFVRRRDGVTVVKACSLPLGILDDVELESSFLGVQPGDALVMVTDGILEAGAGQVSHEEWIRAAVLDAGAADEPGLARLLLDAAAGVTPGERHDDMTVLVVRFWR